MRDQHNNIGAQTGKNIVSGEGHAGDVNPQRAALARSVATMPPATNEKTRQVFVIHGRDEDAREALFDLLRRFSLRPLEWEHLVRETGLGTPSLAKVVSDASLHAQAVVALLTPDDIVALHPSLRVYGDTSEETAIGCQARPNVFLELGMALAIHPARTIILEAGTMRRPADLAGLNYIRINRSGDWCNKLAERLQSAGCPVDRSGNDWQRVARFNALAAHDRRPS